MPVGMFALLRGQFAGWHPSLPALIGHALREVFAQPGVALATSYYSDDPDRHNAITGRPSHARTRANIVEALRRGIPLRAGVIDVEDGQRPSKARAELVDLGVPSVGYDRLRQIGRGRRYQREPSTQLCGQCGNGAAAIGPDGTVRPCFMARWVSLGSVHETPLAAVVGRLPTARTKLVAQGMPANALAKGDRCDPTSTGGNCYPHNCHP